MIFRYALRSAGAALRLSVVAPQRPVLRATANVLQQSRRQFSDEVAAHPLATAAGRGQHPQTARQQWRPHEIARLSAVRRPWSEKARSRAHVRELRQNGMVPVTVTMSAGRTRDLPLAVSERALMYELERGAFFNRAFELDVSGGHGNKLEKETYRVVSTQVNFHPVMNTPISVSFYQYRPIHLPRWCKSNRNAPRKFDVPLEVVNQERAPGLRAGGHVRLALETVPVQALCEQVPQSLPVDISRLEMGGVVQVDQLEWPSTINLLLAGRPEQTLVKIIDRIR